MTESGRRNLRAAGLLLAAALCVPAGNPPHGLWLFSLAGLALLAHSLRFIACARHAFWYFLGYGALAMAITVPWLFRLFPPQVPPALFVLFGLFHAVFGALAWTLTQRGQSPCWSAVVCAAWWTSIEFYRGEWFVLPYPWITPGIALGPTWLSPLVGVYGATFLAVLGGFLVAEVRTRIAGVALSAVLATFACFRPGPVNPTDPLRVAAVQAEVAPFDTYVKLTLAASNRPQLVVWPEAALPMDVRNDAPALMRQIQVLATSRDCTLVFGTQTRIGDGERDWWNTALVVDATGARGEHYKNRPVPLFNDGRAGREARAIPTSLGLVGTPICFDGDSPGVMRRMAAAGATFFAVPSMDAESWSAFEHEQHAVLIRLRAAECGRWVVVASSSGPSQIVDPHGRVHSTLPVMQEGVLCGVIGRTAAKTMFVRFGWVLPYVCAMGAFVGSVLLLRRRA